jgi:hypothetical protein
MSTNALHRFTSQTDHSEASVGAAAIIHALYGFPI